MVEGRGLDSRNGLPGKPGAGTWSWNPAPCLKKEQRELSGTLASVLILLPSLLTSFPPPPLLHPSFPHLLPPSFLPPLLHPSSPHLTPPPSLLPLLLLCHPSLFPSPPSIPPLLPPSLPQSSSPHLLHSSPLLPSPPSLLPPPSLLLPSSLPQSLVLQFPVCLHLWWILRVRFQIIGVLFKHQ